MKRYLTIIIMLFAFSKTYSQTYSQSVKTDSLVFLEMLVIGDDTLPNLILEEIPVFAPKVFSSRAEGRRYNRLMLNVKKAYPFSIIARNELKLMNDSLKHIQGEDERKKFIKEYERSMFSKHEAKLRSLTFSQGRILIKLVYREIGSTSYNLLKEYRGNGNAIFWQGIARLFGSNLKSAYDPKGEDADIEEIVQLIEAGVI